MSWLTSVTCPSRPAGSFGVQELLSGVDLGQRQPGRDLPVGQFGRVQGGLGFLKVVGDLVVGGVGEHDLLAGGRGAGGEQGGVGGGLGLLVAGPGGP